MSDPEPIIELHSEVCRCRGYLWRVRKASSMPSSPCALPGEDLPRGAMLLPASRWEELGMPRTTEGYWLSLGLAEPVFEPAAQVAGVD